MDTDFYKTLLWRAARAAALARDEYRCTAVEHYDVLVDDDGYWTEIPVRCHATDDLHVHHIDRPEDGGDEYALDNLLTLCCSHHTRYHAMVTKQRAERSHRMSPNPVTFS